MKRNYIKKQTVHMCISIEGVLNRYRKKQIKFCDEDDGTQMNPLKAKQIFMAARAEGKRVLPMGDCYRFNYQTGCPGHITSLMPTDEKMIEIENETKFE